MGLFYDALKFKILDTRKIKDNNVDTYMKQGTSG